MMRWIMRMMMKRLRDRIGTGWEHVCFITEKYPGNGVITGSEHGWNVFIMLYIGNIY
jgi:hypothetical protein